MRAPFRFLCKNFNMSLVTFEDLLRLLYFHKVSINTADIKHSEYIAKLIFWLYTGTRSQMTNVKSSHSNSICVLHALLLLAKRGCRTDTTLVSHTYYLILLRVLNIKFRM